MWEWRENTTRGGWRLDAYGTWSWDEPSPLDRADAGIGALRGRGPGLPDPWGEPRVPAKAGVPAMAGVAMVGVPAVAADAWRGPDGEPTPIFQALTVDRSRHHPLDARPEPDGPWSASIPEPHPGSGPLPVQRPELVERREQRLGGLGAVPTVAAPPLPGSDDVPASRAGSSVEAPEDELRRRAERRRRPRSAEPVAAAPGSGRHALLPREEPVGGRHALRG